MAALDRRTIEETVDSTNSPVISVSVEPMGRRIATYDAGHTDRQDQ